MLDIYLRMHHWKKKLKLNWNAAIIFIYRNNRNEIAPKKFKQTHRINELQCVSACTFFFAPIFRLIAWVNIKWTWSLSIRIVPINQCFRSIWSVQFESVFASVSKSAFELTIVYRLKL